MQIINDWSKKLSIAPDFYLGEFYKGEAFELPDALIHAAQILRVWGKCALSIKNTYPDGQNFGYHRLKLACDYCPTKPEKRLAFIDNYNFEVMSYLNGKPSDLMDKLRSVGITGFGIENKTVHLDCRKTGLNHADKYGRYMVFVWEGHYDENGKLITDKNYGL